MYALSSAQMRALEDRCAEAGIRGFTLMENAGRAAALAINGTIPEAETMAGMALSWRLS